MFAAGMSGSMAEAPRKSVGLGFDSWHVIHFPFLSNLVSCTGEHLATQSCMQLENHLTALPYFNYPSCDSRLLHGMAQQILYTNYQRIQSCFRQILKW